MKILKSTGVVRRIDDLGRIVIPKEIRRNLKIRDGENMEIFIDLDTIILKKYSKLEDVITLTEKLGRLVNELTDYDVIITDRDHIIASYGENFKTEKNEVLSNELMKVIDERRLVNEKTSIEITSNFKKDGYFYILPIISSADSIGLIILFSENELSNIARIVAKMVDFLICEQVDIS